MALDQAAFNATVIAVQNNESNFAPYLVSGLLNLNSQGITDTDMLLLANALKVNTSIFYLELSNIKIGDAGANALANALKINTSVTIFYFRSNLISNVGATTLAEALKVNVSLTFLDISTNQIGDIGASALALALTINTALNSLNLGGNQISNPGIEALSTALQVNTVLTAIAIHYNLIDDLGAQAFISALLVNYSLTGIDLNYNSINSSNLSKINALAMRNQQYLQFGPIYDYDNSSTSIRSGANTIKISQGGTINLTPDNLKASSINNATIIIYTFTDVINGDIFKTDTGASIRQCSDADIQARLVSASQSGGSKSLEYSVAATNGTVTTPPHKAAVIFTLQSNPPILINNNFTLVQNSITPITTDNFLAGFANLTVPPLPGLIFNVFNVTGGQFQQVNQTTPLLTFTQGQVIDNQIEFACDNMGQYPSGEIQAGDTNRTDAFVPAIITLLPSSILQQALINLKNNAITLLNLSLFGPTIDNPAIGDWGTELLAAELKNNTSLTTLQLYGNYIGPVGASALAQALIINTSLTTILNLNSNQIGDVGASALAEALKINRSLTNLQMWQNQIGSIGASAIAQALMINTSLTFLVLGGGNPIGDVGAIAVAQALKINTVLTNLYLYTGQISDMGAIALANALTINTSLRALDLYGNSINDAGAVALAQALQVNTSLITLWLDSNQIGTIGIQALAGALAINTSLTFLDLRSNQISDIDALALLSVLQNNYSITKLMLTGNTDINQTTIDAINVLLARNQQYPSFTVNHITATEGKTITLSSANIAATTPTGSIIFTISAAEHGRFINANNQTITTFTQTEIDDGAIRFEAFDFNRIPASYNITATNGNFTTPVHIGSVDFIPVNHAPLLINHIANQTITVDDPFEFHIPKNTFEDLDNDTLRLSVTEPNGAPLPPNLQFNASSNTLSGSFNHTGTQPLLVKATDTYNLSASDEFNLMAVLKPTTTTTTSSFNSTPRTMNNSLNSAGIIAGVVAGVGALAAGGFLLWRRLRSPKSAIDPVMNGEENNTVPMTNIIELERFYSVAAAGDTELQTDKDGYEQPKPLYEVNWPNESDTDPSYDNPWSTQNYELMQKRRTEYGIPMNSGKNQRHNAQIFQPSTGLASYEDIKTTTNEPDKKQPYELLEPGSCNYLN